MNNPAGQQGDMLAQSTPLCAHPRVPDVHFTDSSGITVPDRFLTRGRATV